MRKWVTIRMVDAISPIEGADKIELAHIGGWQCVVKKGEFHTGDMGLFLEIDSFIPSTDDRFKFLGTPKNWNGKEGYRLRTMKLRGQLSQGLLLPISLFPEVLEKFSRDVGEGSESDYSEILGIEKWERPVSPQMQGQARGNFPSFIPKTDQGISVTSRKGHKNSKGHCEGISKGLSGKPKSLEHKLKLAWGRLVRFNPNLLDTHENYGNLCLDCLAKYQMTGSICAVSRVLGISETAVKAAIKNSNAFLLKGGD